MLIVVLEATVASNSYPAFITALPPDGKGSSVNKNTKNMKCQYGTKKMELYNYTLSFKGIRLNSFTPLTP